MCSSDVMKRALSAVGRLFCDRFSCVRGIKNGAKGTKKAVRQGKLAPSLDKSYQKC